MEVLVQAWIESEEGWGIRPDGISIHFNNTQLKEYQEEYWTMMESRYGSKVPHEYSRPEGDPVKMVIIQEGATEDVLELALKGQSIRVYENNPKWLKKL